jgi:hypothetical protein
VQAELHWRGHILIQFVDGAKIAQMPVEHRAALVNSGRDGGHDDVAAIA